MIGDSGVAHRHPTNHAAARSSDKAASEAYAGDYHQPSYEFAAPWNLDGVVEDLEALYGVGRELAAGDRWPNWYEGNPFKATRDRMMQSRQPAAPAAQ